VFDLNLLTEGEIRFGKNSWRGDEYSAALIDAPRSMLSNVDDDDHYMTKGYRYDIPDDYKVEIIDKSNAKVGDVVLFDLPSPPDMGGPPGFRTGQSAAAGQTVYRTATSTARPVPVSELLTDEDFEVIYGEDPRERAGQTWDGKSDLPEELK